MCKTNSGNLSGKIEEGKRVRENNPELEREKERNVVRLKERVRVRLEKSVKEKM